MTYLLKVNHQLYCNSNATALFTILVITIIPYNLFNHWDRLYPISKLLRMKKIILLLTLIPFIGMSQKNVMNAQRVFVKMDKVLEFEKGISAHAQKYHTGEFSWRISEIVSGPDAGGYQISEGPSSWDAIDSRGNLGNEHNIDWNKNVAIYLTERGGQSYSTYQDSISTIALNDWSDKISITHYVTKIGHGYNMWTLLENLRPVWKALGQSVAVFASSSSGPNQYAVVTRYKNGLKDRELSNNNLFKKQYELIHGNFAYTGFTETMRNSVAEVWHELLFYRKDLSSK